MISIQVQIPCRTKHGLIQWHHERESKDGGAAYEDRLPPSKPCPSSTERTQHWGPWYTSSSDCAKPPSRNQQQQDHLGSVQKWDFLNPLPPMSPFVAIFGLPPPSPVTGANGDKLLTVKMAGEKLIKLFVGLVMNCILYEKSVNMTSNNWIRLLRNVF